MRQIVITGLLGLALLAASCRSTSYQMSGIERTRLTVDKRYDAQPDAEATAFLAPYKIKVDSLMSPVVGEVDHYMSAQRPESDLSNLLADILVWSGQLYNERPDFGVYNMGGIRAAIAKGKVTYGDVLDVAPFENKICFLTLSGEKTLELMRQIARRGGEGVSHGIQLVITPDGQMKSAKLNGQPISADRSYRIATLDYLAQGNDQLEAFQSKTQVVSPQEEHNNIRYIICKYFRDQAQQGHAVSSRVEGRIKVE